MKKEKYYWKVVQTVKTLNLDGVTQKVYKSANRNLLTTYSVEYKLGIESKPIVGGKLFVFDTREDARWFKRRMVETWDRVEWKILKVKVTGTPTFVSCVLSNLSIEVSEVFNKYWENPDSFLYSHEGYKSPTGTLVVDSVIPVEFSH